MSMARQHISNSELAVLRCLGARKPGAAQIETEITEISFNTGIRDNDEVLRALYTLEGKRLVRPQPLGDFTSNHWQITDHGIKALEIMHEA